MAFYIRQKYNASVCCSAGKYIALLRSAEEMIVFVLTGEELEVLSIGHCLKKIMAIT